MTHPWLLALLTSIAALTSACGCDPGFRATDGGGNGASCGAEELGMTGAFELSTLSIATVKVNNVVVGVGGFGAGNPPSTSYTLSLRNALVGELGSVGVHDVTAANLKYLVAPANANCQTAGACAGFVATSGTYEVLATSPHYRATFWLTGLHAYDGSTSTLGAAVAGQVTGCLDAAQ